MHFEPNPAPRHLGGVAPAVCISLSLFLFLFLAAAPTGLAREDLAAPTAPTASAASFLVAHGDGWRVVFEPVAGHPSFVYGGRFALPAAPRTDAGYVAAARQVVDLHAELFGFDAPLLVDRAVKHLDLSRIGSSDKVAVQFDQVVGGVPVFRGTATVLFDRESGDVLALDTTGVPFADRAAAAPLGFGCTLHLGTVLPSALPVTLNGAGTLSVPVALPPNAPALDLFLQYFGNDTGGPNGTYSTSNGLQLHF